MSDSYNFSADIVVQSIESISENETISNPYTSFYYFACLTNNFERVFISILNGHIIVGSGGYFVVSYLIWLSVIFSIIS